MSRAENPYGTRTVDASALSLDPEFAGLLPSPPSELADTLDALAEDACPERFIVWPCGGRLILLVGYDRLPYFQRKGLGIPIEERIFASHEHARLFILRWRLSRRNLTALEISYYVGLAYQEEKQPHGGDRRSKKWPGLGRTAEALAEAMYFSPRTIRLGAELKKAAWKIADLCGPDIIPLLFSRRAHLGRKTFMDLAGAEPDKLRPMMGRLRVDGKLPRSWRRELFGEAPDITLPRAQGPMAEAIVRRLGLDWLAAFIPVAHEVLTEHNSPSGGKPAPKLVELVD
jgi:hypothetical protein